MYKKFLYPVIGIVVATAVGTGSYILIQNQILPENSTQKKQNKHKKDKKTVKKHVPNNPSTSLKSNVDFEYQLPSEKSSLSLKLKGFKLLSFDKGLKQRIAADKIKAKVQENQREKTFSLQNINIIGNEENVYFRIGDNNIGINKKIINLLNKSKLSSNIQKMLKSEKSQKLNDIGTLLRALSTFQADYEANPKAIIPTEGLTPVKYKGEIVSYQGTFDKDYFQNLKRNGFDILIKRPKTPQGRPYIISVGKDKKKFQLGTVINQNNSMKNALRGNYSEGQKKIGNNIKLPSLIYKGNIESGNYKISKTNLQNPEDIKGFIKDEGNDPLIYQLNKETTKTDSKFIKIDNSQKILKILGDLGDKELISQIVKGFSSSNPQAYFEKYDIDEKLKNKLFHEGFYKILFKEKKQKNDKTYLAIKEKNCDIIEKIYKNISSMNPNISSENFQKEQCLTAVKKANKIIGEHLYVTKQQNKETIYYKGIANFELSYKKGKIINFELNTPIGLHSEYKDNHLSINFASEFLKAQGHDLNASAELDIKEKISGKINIDYKSEKFGKANFHTDIQNNEIKNFETQGNLKNGQGSKLIFQGKGDKKEGEIKAKISKGNKKMGTAIFKYREGKNTLKITSPQFDLTTLLKENSLQWQTKLNIPNKLDLSSSGKIRKKNWWIKTADIKFNSQYQKRSYFSDDTTKINQNFSLKYKNNNLNFNRNIDKNDEKFKIFAKGKLKYNNTDINFAYNDGKGKVQGNLKHKNNNLTSTININPPRQKEFTIKTDGKFIFDLWNNIKLSSNVKINQNILKTRKNKSKQSRKLSDIGTIERALSTYQADYDVNPTATIPTEGLTPVKYKGEIISYQGTFDESYFQTLQQNGFDILKNPPKTPQDRPYIISVDKDKKLFNIGTIISQNNSSKNAIRGSYGKGQKEINNTHLPSLIYKGRIEEGTYQISETKIQDSEDIKGFVKDDGNNPLIYQPNNKNSPKEENMKFTQIGSGKFVYKKEKNAGKTQINSSAQIQNQGNTVVKATLTGNYSKGEIQYYTPSEFTEKTLPGLTTLKLPNFSSLKAFMPNQKIVVVGGGIVGASTIGTSLIPKIIEASQSKTETRARARDSARKGHLNQLSTALSTYLADKGKFPKSSGLQKTKILKKKLTPTYIGGIPEDPKKDQNYYYASIKRNGAKNSGMILVSKVENPNNGNFSASNIQDLWQKIKDKNKEARKIEKIIKERGNFYIVTQ